MSAVQATFAATLVDEWVRAGVTDAVVCPGSRSTPLTLALGRRPELTVHVRLDERSAGFFALGLALATGRPSIVCVTSGTAAAELHAAVVEAHHARVPVLVCTADRPPEVHDVGAPQTIEQGGLYASAVRWSFSPGVPLEETAGTWRSLAARAVAEATAGPLGPGPVHLNLAFRDPLVGDPDTLLAGRANGAPWHRVLCGRVHPEIVPWPGRRGVIVAGAHAGPPALVLGFSAWTGWPVLADPRSGARTTHPNVVASADAIARAAPADLVPDVVVRLGAAWASKALPAFLAEAVTIAVDPWWRWEDPGRTAGLVQRADPSDWLEAACRAAPPETPGDWLPAWQRAERLAQETIDAALADEGLCEPVVARRLFSALPQYATLVVSSSMPVRDLEWFAPTVPQPPMVLANRGANGIDGVCSTALGVAAAGRGPVVAVVGDLAFFHDLSALVCASDSRPVECTIVVVDNGGGGIFELLPQASALERETFDRFFGTPQAPDVARTAAGLGLPCADVGTPEELEEALAAALLRKELSVVRVRVPARPGNAAVHARLHGALDRALG